MSGKDNERINAEAMHEPLELFFGKSPQFWKITGSGKPSGLNPL